VPRPSQYDVVPGDVGSSASAASASTAGGGGGDDEIDDEALLGANAVSTQEAERRAQNGTFEPFWVRAIGDFTAVEEGDLTIRYLQLIEILDMQPNGWWAGRLDNRVGWLPMNHVERVDPLEIFLTKIGLIKIYALLVEQDVDMESLRLLTDDDLASIGVKLGPRKALLKALGDDVKVRRLSHRDEISHHDVRRTMSKQFRTGEEPANTRATKDKPAHLAGVRVRTSQFLHATKDATEADFIAAALYIKVIIPEQNLYKILSFEGSMKVKDMAAKVQERLATPLKKGLSNYAIFMPAANGADETQLDPAKQLGTYKLANMSVLSLRLKKSLLFRKR
jgi:hypothetical protein